MIRAPSSSRRMSSCGLVACIERSFGQAQMEGFGFWAFRKEADTGRAWLMLLIDEKQRGPPSLARRLDFTR